MNVFRYANQSNRLLSGEKIGLFYSIFAAITAGIFFLAFDPSNFATFLFIGLMVGGMLLLIVLWLRQTQKLETVYVLDEQGDLWQLFMQSEAAAQISKDVVLRIESLHKDLPATENQENLHQKDAFMIAVVQRCKDDPQMKQTLYQGGSIIKELHDPIVMASYDTGFIVQFIDEKGQQKEIRVPHNYIGLEQALKNNR